MEKETLEVQIQSLKTQNTSNQKLESDRIMTEKGDSEKLLAEVENNRKLHEKLEIAASKIQKLEEQLRNQEVCQTPRSSGGHDLDSSKADQLRSKLSSERDSWAKEKRRLESKIRHLSKKQGIIIYKLSFIYMLSK